jgi:simple sugar transport system ATP-binding protein
MTLEGKSVHFHKPVERRARRHRGRLSGSGALQLPDRLGQCLPGTRGRCARFGPFQLLDDRAMNERSRVLFAELKSETLPAEVVRYMWGGHG